MITTGLQYKAVCIFASPRTGSNLLVERLCKGLNTVHQLNTRPLYEYLSPHSYITNDLKCGYVDPTHLLTRPAINGIDIDRLEKLDSIYDRNIVPVFKIFSNDHSTANRPYMHKHILNDNRVYKICLNRIDIKNQIYSYCIAMSTGVWHLRNDATPISQRIYRKLTISQQTLDEIGTSILMHWAWQAEHAKQTCDQTVWYADINHTDFPKLGIISTDCDNVNMVKNTEDHQDLAELCIENLEDLDQYADRISKSLTQISKDIT